MPPEPPSKSRLRRSKWALSRPHCQYSELCHARAYKQKKARNAPWHDLHNDYPLAPELMEVNKIEKLIPNLNNKTNYIIHHESLKLYEKLGLWITKIHRGIKFVESNWLEPYIMKNTNLRMQGKNNFEKDFFKLMNNSVFGKTMENIKKQS